MTRLKKKYPRSVYVIFRATKGEKRYLEEEAMKKNMDFSKFMRRLVGFIEENE